MGEMTVTLGLRMGETIEMKSEELAAGQIRNIDEEGDGVGWESLDAAEMSERKVRGLQETKRKKKPCRRDSHPSYT